MPIAARGVVGWLNQSWSERAAPCPGAARTRRRLDRCSEYWTVSSCQEACPEPPGFLPRPPGAAPRARPLHLRAADSAVLPLCLKWYLMLLLLRSPGGPVCSSRGPAAQRPWPGRSSPEVVRRWGRPSPSPPWDSGRLRSRLFHPLRAAPLRSDRSRRRRSPPLLSLPPCCSSCCRPSSASPPRAPAVPAASRLQAPQSRGCSSPVSQTWRAGPPAARTCASPGAGTAAGWSGSGS
mmetsp:Transcript_18835/g.71305  ORF Transcript_18835/g.71305 Transcript_18835/m.71305 type:complete len:236 (-) Transcript_18835:629-1336(-)